MTPGGSPGVFDEPVVQASQKIITIADSDHGVVNWVEVCLFMSVAIMCIYDATLVGMNIFIISCNRNGKWMFFKGGLHLTWATNITEKPKKIVVFNGDAGGPKGAVLAFVNFVRISTWFERILARRHRKVLFFITLFKVFKGIVHVATVASFESRRLWVTTVDELLLREGNKFSRFYKVGTLEGSNCGKGPACSAMCLVFDWGNSTSLYPIYVIGKIGLV